MHCSAIPYVCLQLWVVSTPCNDTCISHCYFNHSWKLHGSGPQQGFRTAWLWGRVTSLLSWRRSWRTGLHTMTWRTHSKLPQKLQPCLASLRGLARVRRLLLPLVPRWTVQTFPSQLPIWSIGEGDYIPMSCIKCAKVKNFAPPLHTLDEYYGGMVTAGPWWHVNS